MSSRHPFLRKALKGGAIAGGLVFLLWSVTEFVFFFPLTNIQLASADNVHFPPVDEGTVRVVFVGDILLGDAGRSILGKKGYDYPFGALGSLLRRCDAAVGNLEGPIAVRARKNRAKRWSYKADPRSVSALERAGFDALTLANNHILDCGADGVRETMQFLDGRGIRYFGAGANEDQARRPVILTLKGIKVAVFGYLAPYQLMGGRMVAMSHLGAGSHRAGAAMATVWNLHRDLASIRSSVDVQVVFLHMGDRYQVMPTAFERALAHEAIDAGADAVVACGTHIMGPVETYRDKPIVHSLGNFAFGSGNMRARFSLMAFLDISKHGVQAVRLIPIYTANWNPMVWFQPKRLAGWQGRQVLGRLSRLSSRFGAVLERKKEGWALLDLAGR